MTYKKLRDSNWLKMQYVNELRTLQSIADEIGCNKSTVRRALNRQGVKCRTKTSKYKKLNNKEWLVNAYVNDGRSLNDIAREAGSTPGNIADHLKTLGIERRKISSAIKLAKPNQLGSNAANWKGGRKAPSRGGYIYVYAPDHLNATKAGYVMEHRLIAEGIIGRYLTSGEIVHHLDGDKKNNSPDNLEVLTRSEHVMRHFEAVKHVRGLQAEVKELEAEIVRLRAEIKQL